MKKLKLYIENAWNCWNDTDKAVAIISVLGIIMLSILL